MAEPTPNPTLETITQLEDQNIQALKARIEQERQARLTQARGQAISRGLQGSSWETRAASEVNRLADEAMANGEREIRGQYSGQRLQLEETERARQWQALEEEKQRAFQAGENEKAQTFAEQQAQLQRESDEANARSASRAALASGAAQVGAMALLTPGAISGAKANVASLFGRAPASTLNAAPATGAAPAAVPGAATGAAAPAASGAPAAAPGLFSRPIGPGGSTPLGFAASTAGGAYLGQIGAGGLFGDRYNTNKATSRGGKAGSLVGAGLGTYLGGPLGGAAGGVVGGAVGSNIGSNLSRIADTGVGASSNKGLTLKNLASGFAKKPLKATENIVKAFTPTGVINSIGKKLFCFLPDTPVEVQGDKTVPIGDIQLGDDTLGGVVVSIRRSLAEDLHDYMGIHVTGTHAVKEDGEWIRVGDSKRSVPIPGVFEVVSIVTERHRIYSMGLCFADEDEVDGGSEISNDEAIRILNREEANNGASSI